MLRHKKIWRRSKETSHVGEKYDIIKLVYA